MMSFRVRALMGYTAVGLVLLAFGVWLALTGTTIDAVRYRSPVMNRLLGIGSIVGSMYMLIPGLWMLSRCRHPAIESDDSHVVVRAVSGRPRTLKWSDIRRVSFKPYAVDLRLRSGKRVRVYGQFIGAGGSAAIEKVARFFAKRLRPQDDQRH